MSGNMIFFAEVQQTLSAFEIKLNISYLLNEW